MDNNNIGVLEGWSSKRLIDLATYVNGKAFKPVDWGEDGLPIIRIEQLRNPVAKGDHFKGPLPPSYIVEDGDLLFSWSASLFLRIWQHGEAALNQHIFKVVPRDGVDLPFLKAFIEHHLPALIAASHGSTMQHITRGELKRFCAPFPDAEEEQAKIAKIASIVDRAISLTEAGLAKQERIKTGMMQDLLTRGIDDYGQVRSEDTHEFKESELGRIPDSWETTTLQRLTLRIVDGVHSTPAYTESGVPFVVISDLTSGSSINFASTRFVSEDDHTEFAKRAKPETGDVLVTKDGTLGVARVVPSNAPEFSIFVSVAMLRPRPELCLPELIWSFFESGEFMQQLGALSSGTGLKHIHLEQFRRFVLRRPPVDEQHLIFLILNQQDVLLERMRLSLAKLRRIRSGVLQDLLTGAIRVGAAPNKAAVALAAL